MSSYDYIITSDGELYHHGVKGMKWGVRRFQKKDGSLTAAGKKRSALIREPEDTVKNKDSQQVSNNKHTAMGTTMRIAKLGMKDMQNNFRINTELVKASYSDMKSAIKYATISSSLPFKHRERFINKLNSYLDEIGDDLSKITIEKDFFTRHQNDNVEDILNDGNSAMVSYLMLMNISNNQNAEAARRAQGMM